MESLILQNEEKLKQHQAWENDEEIQIFREYLRFDTVHPNINYRKRLYQLYLISHLLIKNQRDANRVHLTFLLAIFKTFGHCSTFLYSSFC